MSMSLRDRIRKRREEEDDEMMMFVFPAPYLMGSSRGGEEKKTAGSPRVKQRAYWNPALEKSLVDILHEHKDSGFRGDKGWSPEGWNKIVEEFQVRNRYVSFTKVQIQEKERELKRDYKMLKEARKQSGCKWNEERCMIEGSPALWDNLIIKFSKIKKFRNLKASFPLFDACGELYDGHLAEGTYNFTSTNPLEEEPLTLIEDLEGEDEGASLPRGQEGEDEHATESGDQEGEVPASVQVIGQKRRAAPESRKKEEKEAKRSRKSANRGVMERYPEMRTKQAEDEAAQIAREKESARVPDFSIMRCVSVLNTMEVTKQEKAKAYALFKTPENREIFLSACNEDPEAAMIWLRSEMA